MPKTLDPATPAGYTDIFGAPDDYGWNVEPAFSSCVWVERVADPALAGSYEAWLPSSQSAAYSQRTDLAGRLALVVPPPAWLNGKPVTYNTDGIILSENGYPVVQVLKQALVVCPGRTTAVRLP